jgi:ATP-binding cassette subfamily C protein
MHDSRLSLAPDHQEAEHLPDSRDGYTWRYVLNIALEHKRVLLVANVVALFAVLASVPIPLLFPLLVDEVLLDQPGSLRAFMDGFFPAAWHGPVLYIGVVLVATVALRLIALTLSVWQVRQFSLMAKEITYRIRRALLGRLQRVSMSEYETMGSGTVTSHFVTDLNAVDDFIGESIAKSLVSALTLVGITAVLLWMHWQLALFIIFMNPLVIYFTMAMGRRVKDLKKTENKAFEVFQQALTETLDGIQQIRASNRERHYITNVMDRARAIKEHSAAFSWKSDAASRLSMGVFLFGFDTFRAISMLMVVFSNLSVGEMMAVFGYLWFMMAPVQDLLTIQYKFFAAKAALGRVNELLKLHQEPQYPHRKNPFAGKETVGLEIEDVSFAYSLDNGEEEPSGVLNHVSFSVAPGEKVALVGASGGGKSTLVQVILGMYVPQSGVLRFDGVPVTEIGLDVVREHVVTVLQHPVIFNDTVRANLSLGHDLSDEQMWLALDVAQLRDVVEEMPQGLDTIVGRQGVRLSGGQRQRLAIARMVLANPSVVILDEATSALDAETESKLHRALNQFLQGRTTLIVAHRLSAVKQADRVVVFENGEIIEDGRHEELIKSDGLYNRLYGNLQH